MGTIPGTYFHMIHKYPKWAEVANYNVKKSNSRIQNPGRLQWGVVKGLELNRIPILEPWDLSPGGILDTS